MYLFKELCLTFNSNDKKYINKKKWHKLPLNYQIYYDHLLKFDRFTHIPEEGDRFTHIPG